MAFELLIKHYRNKLKITQEKLAEDSGVSRRYLFDIENGKKVPSLEILHSIAKALKLKTNSLIKDI